jgi:trk system potassium uptake protein TrkH
MQQGLVKFVGALAGYPARMLFAWYIGLVLVGTALLLLPACRAPGADPLSLGDALFTATSAASVTGLMVRSVATDLSFTGQLVVLFLIQLGGLGIMSLGTLLFVSLTGRQPVQYRLLTRETLGAPLDARLGPLILMVLAVALAIEAVGALALLLARLGDGPFSAVLWWAVFHAVSGFCNAGIALQDASLAPWAGDPAIILTMAALIIAGGLGFPVLLDLLHLRRRAQDRRGLRFHSRLLITATLILLAGGTLAIWLGEHDGALGAMPAWQALMNAFFQSVTARTAGFATLPVEHFSYPTLMILLLLMFIGGGACSTAGGVKVSTVAVLTVEGVSLLRRRWQTVAFRHGIPTRVLATAAAVVVVYALVLMVGIMLLLVLEAHDRPHADAGGHFMDMVFEAVSALGTVGLSTGVTRDLGDASRLVVVAMMLVGRVGPLAMASLLLRGPKGPKIRYPESEVIVG